MAASITDLGFPIALRSRQRADEGPAEAPRHQTKAQSAGSIEELYDLYADNVFGLALWILGSSDEAAEVVQDTFVRLLTWGRPLAEIREPKAFLLRSCRTAALDRIRKRRPTQPLAEEALLASATDDPESRARAEEVSRAVSALPPKQREALYLRFFVGLTLREIGQLTRVPTFTVASRCRLGLSKLRRRLTR